MAQVNFELNSIGTGRMVVAAVKFAESEHLYGFTNFQCVFVGNAEHTNCDCHITYVRTCLFGVYEVRMTRSVFQSGNAGYWIEV